MSGSIEEAFETLIYGKRPEGAPEGIVEGLTEEEHMGAARVLALAVHRESCKVCVDDEGLEMWCTVRCGIEALGAKP